MPMKTHQLIASANLGPKQLRVISKVFDDAWARIASAVGKRPESIAATARIKLAHVVLGLARNGTPSREHLTDAALKMMFADPTPLRR